MSARNEFNNNFKYTILLVGISSIASFFIFGRAVSISILLGGATILWGMSHLAKQNRKMISDQPTTKGGRIGFIIRFTLYAIVLWVSHYMDTLNIFGTLYGLLTFKIALYGHAFISSIRGGKTHE